MEMAMHLTGLYPDWWEGIVFDKAPVIWVGGITGEVMRDTSQRLLLGRLDADQLGEGTIPKDLIIYFARAMGVKNAVDFIEVKHTSGRSSLLYFKAYSMGRSKFQGETIDLGWCDEEPPSDIYSEMATRTSKGQNGIRMMLTFTPLLGRTTIVNDFLSGESPQKHHINYTLDECEHYTDEEKESMVLAWPEHERDARAKGIPILGAGRIFTTMEDEIKEDPMSDDSIPAHWFFINGIDFGYDHPTAVVQMVHDRDNDVIHVTKIIKNSLKITQASIPDIAQQIKNWGADVPTAWPHDGLQHDKGGSNKQIKFQYEECGVNMLFKMAEHEGGGNGVEAGILEMTERMRSGRLKFGADLDAFWQEYRLYHRKDGKIVKEFDDVISAVRYGMMMIRYAEQRRDKVKRSLRGINRQNKKTGGGWV